MRINDIRTEYRDQMSKLVRTAYLTVLEELRPKPHILINDHILRAYDSQFAGIIPGWPITFAKRDRLENAVSYKDTPLTLSISTDLLSISVHFPLLSAWHTSSYAEYVPSPDPKSDEEIRRIVVKDAVTLKPTSFTTHTTIQHLFTKLEHAYIAWEKKKARYEVLEVKVRENTKRWNENANKEWIARWAEKGIKL